MSKYEIGDKVIRLDCGSPCGENLKPGEIYEIIALKDGYFFFLDNLGLKRFRKESSECWEKVED